ncbi:MAG: energy transducer TonB [Butyricimonas virosa]
MTLKPFHAKLKSLAKLQIGLVSVFLIFNTHTAISQIQDKQTVQDSTEDNQVHFLVQEMPVFPGNLNTWIYNNIRYPEIAKEKKLEGKVYVRFVIEKDGAISNVKVIRGVSPELDNEAKAVIASMPKWEPGKQNGSPVRVSYTVPVYFALRSTSPSVERRTFDRYLKVLTAEEEKLKNGLDTVPQASFDMYCLYLKKRYGSDKAVYKGIITSAREQQQSSEIMLSIVMPTMSLPVSDKNKILQFYKEEWDEQIRLIDSLPTEDFTSEYVRITLVSGQRPYEKLKSGIIWERRSSKDTSKTVFSIPENSFGLLLPTRLSVNGRK